MILLVGKHSLQTKKENSYRGSAKWINPVVHICITDRNLGCKVCFCFLTLFKAEKKLPEGERKNLGEIDFQ